MKYKRLARRLAASGFGLMILSFIVGQLRIFPGDATAATWKTLCRAAAPGSGGGYGAGSTCSYASITSATGNFLMIVGVLLVLAAAGVACARILKPADGRHRVPATEKTANI
jgi:hypothetical protein